MTTPLRTVLLNIIKPIADDMNTEVMSIETYGTPMVVDIRIQNANGSAATIDQCAKLSHAISVALDLYDPIEEAYTLEVGSGGIRPMENDEANQGQNNTMKKQSKG